jgi:hypothetical protein
VTIALPAAVYGYTSGCFYSHEIVQLRQDTVPEGISERHSYGLTALLPDYEESLGRSLACHPASF